MQWLLNNWSQILAIGLLIVRVLESIAVITPTDADNKVVAFIKEFFRIG